MAKLDCRRPGIVRGDTLLRVLEIQLPMTLLLDSRCRLTGQFSSEEVSRLTIPETAP